MKQLALPLVFLACLIAAPRVTIAQAPPAMAPAVPPKDYKLGADSLPQEGVPKGKLEGPFLFKSQVYTGTVRKYWVYVPAQYDRTKPAALVVFQDGQRASNPNGSIRAQNVMDNLIHRKEMPMALGLFITPGHRAEEYPDTLGFSNPNNRSEEYDSMGDAYARFICDEMLSEVAKSYSITKDPEGRAIAGWSSGAIAAFTVAWSRPNEFRKVISAIGSFTNIRGGHVFPELVRTTPKKPIRIFIQDGIHDNRNVNPDRDWYLQNQKMVEALKAQNYDHQAVFGEGGHSDGHGGAILPEIMRWIWRDYPK